MDCDDMAVLDDAKDNGGSVEAVPQPIDSRASTSSAVPPSPLTKTRSLSDGGGSTPSRGRLSPSPLLLGSSGRRTWKDDSSIGSPSTSMAMDTAPVTPRRSLRDSLQLPDGFSLPRQQQQHTPKQSQQELPPAAKDAAPSTPVATPAAQLAAQLHQQQQQLFLNQPTYMPKPIPLSPKLDPSQIYASPTNILPRRSRGLDFSRAATSLHHSTLAEQPSPGSSPTASSGSLAAMNIPAGRKQSGEYGGAAVESSSSLWSMMGRNHDSTTQPSTHKMYPSSSLGSANNMAATDSSSSSDDDDIMDDDPEEAFVTTPQVGKIANSTATTPGMAGNVPQMAMPWMVPSSPAMNSLLSFQHRQRPRKQPKRKKVRGPLGLGFSSISTASTTMGGGGGSLISRSPPIAGGYTLGRDVAGASAHSRRESISWAANQLHISGGTGSESDENNFKSQMGGEGDGLPTTPGREGQRGVIRRAVTRRGNLLPKTKGFARIRAALAEESAPVESDFRREAEVVRQVLESDMEPERLPPPPALRSAVTTANSSPRMFDNMEDIGDDIMAMDAGSGLGLSAGFRPLMGDRIPKARNFWESLGSPRGSPGGSLGRTTPPPSMPRDASSGLFDDMSMDSPSGGPRPMSSNSQSQQLLQANSQSQSQGQQSLTVSQASSAMIFPHGGIFPMTATTGSSSGGDGTPPQPGQPASLVAHQLQAPLLPSAAEITRRINSKRRRDDDFDPVSFKRRAVSPGMSVHNSPIMQSPLQRDVTPWGAAGSRPGSVGNSCENKALLLPPLIPSGSGAFLDPSGLNVGSGSASASGSASGASSGGRVVGGTKARVGYQAMADANDSITRLSIE